MNYKLSKEADNDLINLYLHGFKSFGEAQAEQYYFELEDCIKLLRSGRAGLKDNSPNNQLLIRTINQ